MFQECLEGVLRKIEGVFNGVLSGVQGCSKEVKLVFEECFKGQGSFMGVSRKMEGCS